MASNYSDPPRRAGTLMGRMKKTTAQIRASTSGHSHLSMVIYQDKCMRQALHKVGTAKLQISKAITDWIKNEQHPGIRQLAELMAELDRMWIRAHDEYNEQYSAHRNTFKEILKGAKLIDEKVRKTDAQAKKIAKMQKQIEAVQKKQDSIKQSALETDLEHENNYYKEIMADLDYYKDQHEKFKFLKFQEAYQVQSDSGTLLQSKCAHITDARQKLLSLVPRTIKAAAMPEAVITLRDKGQNVINELAATLEIPRSRGNSEAEPTKLHVARVPSIEGSLSDIDDEEGIYSPFPRSESQDSARESDSEVLPGRSQPSAPEEDAYDPSYSSPPPPSTPERDSYNEDCYSLEDDIDDEFDDDMDDPVYGNVESSNALYDPDPIYDVADMSYSRSPPVQKARPPKPPPPSHQASVTAQLPDEGSTSRQREEDSIYANMSIRERKSKLLLDPSAESTPL